MFWKVRAMPHLATWWGFDPVMSRQSDATRQNALWTQQHHPYQDRAVDDEVEPPDLLGQTRPVPAFRIQRAQADAVREVLGILRQPGYEVEDEEVQDQCADDDPADVAH